MKSYSMRLWPNGEFGLSLVRKFKPEPLPEQQQLSLVNSYSWTKSELLTVLDAVAVYGCLSTAMERLCPGFYLAVLEEVTPLGSSNVPNSHTRSKRGRAGLSSYAKRMLRNGCYLMENRARRREICMITCTLPPGPEGMEQAFSHQWHEIVRVFTQWLHRRLKKASALPWVLGVTEVQEKRAARLGGLPLHLHVVFQGRRNNRYILKPSEVCEAWERACNACIPQSECLSFDASTRIELVRKSIAGYLSKYMQKGSTLDMESLESQGYKIPSSWWIGVGTFKAQIKKMMVVTSGADARMLHDAMYDTPQLFLYVGKIYLGEGDEARCIAWYGTVRKEVRNMLQGNAKERKSNQSVLVNAA